MNDTLCRKCGEPIRFKRNRDGKWRPVDQYTGKDHWPECYGQEALLTEDEQAMFDHCVYGKD